MTSAMTPRDHRKAWIRSLTLKPNLFPALLYHYRIYNDDQVVWCTQSQDVLGRAPRREGKDLAVKNHLDFFSFLFGYLLKLLQKGDLKRWEDDMKQPLCRTVWQLLQLFNWVSVGPSSTSALAQVYHQEISKVSNKNLYVHGYSRIAPHGQKGEIIKMPLTDEWINKMWYIHTREDYLAIKRKEVLMYTPTRMNLENTMLGGKSQLQSPHTV